MGPTPDLFTRTTPMRFWMEYPRLSQPESLPTLVLGKYASNERAVARVASKLCPSFTDLVTVTVSLSEL